MLFQRKPQRANEVHGNLKAGGKIHDPLYVDTYDDGVLAFTQCAPAREVKLKVVTDEVNCEDCLYYRTRRD